MVAGGLQHEVRNEVFREVFRSGGAVDFLDRLERYRPALVLLAPTKDVRHEVRDVLAQSPRRWPWVFATGHPFSWASHAGLKQPLEYWSREAEDPELR
jgi:hypothetical protein